MKKEKQILKYKTINMNFMILSLIKDKMLL